MFKTPVMRRGTLFTSPQEGWDLNLYLIRGRRFHYLIDTGLGSGSMEALHQELRGDDTPVIVINTHYHWDHIWGNASAPGGLIVSHKLCPGLIERNWSAMLEAKSGYRQGETALRLPDLVFDRELYFAEDGIRLIHTPGHTEDSISVLDEQDRVLFAGDNLGDTPEELLPSLAAPKETYLDTLSLYERLPFDLLLSGHNRIFDRSVLSRVRSLL